MKAIVAVDANWGIGKNGDQLCYISADLKRFKSMTLGHPVILGRKTLATLPGGRPLQGRRNMILSRDPMFRVEGGEVYHSLTALMAAAPEDAFIIGGGTVYSSLLNYCDTIYVTKIQKAFEVDTWFPDLDADPRWRIAHESEDQEENGITFRYVVYERAD